MFLDSFEPISQYLSHLNPYTTSYRNLLMPVFWGWLDRRGLFLETELPILFAHPPLLTYQNERLGIMIKSNFSSCSSWMNWVSKASPYSGL